MPKDKFADFDKALGAFSQRTTTVVARTGRTFILRELNGAELLSIDRMVPYGKDFAPVDVLYRRAVAAIVSINDVAIPVLDNDMEIREMISRMHGTELEDTSNAYQKEFEINGEELKNESGATSVSNESPTPLSPESRSRKRSSSPTES